MTIISISLALFSILGALVVIVGLYMLLWGKEGDEKVDIKSEESNDNKAHQIDSEGKDALNVEP